MNKKSGTALGAYALCVDYDVLCVITLREVGAGNELTVSAFLINKFGTALRADLTGLLGLKCDLVDRFLSRFDL